MGKAGAAVNDAQLARFMAKVDLTLGCWNWTGAVMGKGYGMFRLDGRRPLRQPSYAHRVAYEHFVGVIPDGLHIDHLCRNRACVNPAHLEPVTNRENLLRGERATRTHCPHGHAYDPRESYKDGRRYCRPCKREAVRRARAA